MHPHVKEPTTPALIPERRSETEVYAYSPPLVHPTGDNILHITRELFNPTSTGSRGDLDQLLLQGRQRPVLGAVYGA
jgi:hypothetical protein